MNAVTKTVSTALLLLFLLPSALFSQKQSKTAEGGDSLPAMPQVQSPFYDATALYYTAMGYKVYPLVTENTNNQGLFNQTPKGSGPPFADGACYDLIECSSGKIIINACGDLATILEKYAYAAGEEGTRDATIDSLLVRNVHTILPNPYTHNDIRNAFAGNPYIQDMLGSMPALTHEARLFLFQNNKLDLAGVNATSLRSKTGGAAQSLSTVVAEGITDFLIQRVNEEFNDAFLVHLYHVLHNDKIPELAILFPNTLESLDKIELTQYSASLNAIKTAYQADLKSILSHVGALAKLPRYKTLITKYHWLTLLFTAADLLDGINKKMEPGQLLYQLGQAEYITGVPSNNYSSVAKLAALVSNSLRDVRMGDENPEKNGWISSDQLVSLRTNKGIFNVFMGIMTQNAGGIVFQEGATNFNFQDELIQQKGPILTGQYILYNFSQTADKINKIVGDLKASEGKTPKISDYVSGFINVANELLGLSGRCLDVLPTTPELLRVRSITKSVSNTWLPIVKQADSVLVGVENNNYQGAVYAVDGLVQQLVALRMAELKADSLAAEADIAKDRASKADINAAKDRLKGIMTSLENTAKFSDQFLHYGLFIASVAGAKSATDVKDAISAFALPKGSSRIKKEHTFTVGLNAYVGGYFANNTSYSNLTLPGHEFGITAPIGLGINLGMDKLLFWHVPQYSLSLYGGLLDVGAIFTYKAQGDTLKSDIELGQIFSPSAGIVLGLPIINKYNIPMSIGANIQWGPKLHTVSDAGNSVFPLLVKRYTIFLAFDLPIINFYTSRKTTRGL